MSNLSGTRDVDREILNKLDDKELLKICSIDRYTWNNVCDDGFLRRRLLAKYPKIEQYKGNTETWKHFFLRAVHYIALMKENYNYDYSFGNFVRQNQLLKDFSKDKIKLLLESAGVGELALIEWKEGANIHSHNDDALRWASIHRQKEVAKYLIEHGANIHTNNDVALRWFSGSGDLEMTKYLLERGANIHALNDYALRFASHDGNLEVVKYLVEHDANINAEDGYALRKASEKGHLEVVKYLVEHGTDIHAKNDEALKNAKNLEIAEYLKKRK